MKKGSSPTLWLRSMLGVAADAGVLLLRHCAELEHVAQQRNVTSGRLRQQVERFASFGAQLVPVSAEELGRHGQGGQRTA